MATLPIIYIKMRPYLKEFLMGLEDARGNKLYPKEPVQFAPKTKLRMLVDRFRYLPPTNHIPLIPKTRAEKREYLAVEVQVSDSDKNDKLRTYIGKDAQCRISSHIYDELLITAAEYLKQFFATQEEMFPGSSPTFRSAYRSFFSDYGIESMEEDTLRKALERRDELLPFQSVKNKFERKIKKSAKIGANPAFFGASAAQSWTNSK